MARLQTSTQALFRRTRLADRIVEVQDAVYPGNGGASNMARDLGVDRVSWSFYTRGLREMPGLVVLKLIVRHRVAWQFLLHGTGPMFEPVQRDRTRTGTG